MRAGLNEAMPEGPINEGCGRRFAVRLFLYLQLCLAVAEHRPALMRRLRLTAVVEAKQTITVGAGQSSPWPCLEQQPIGRV